MTALDDHTVVFTLHEPFSAFPMQLTGVPPIVPADAGDSLRTFPIGTGHVGDFNALSDVKRATTASFSTSATRN